MAHTVLFIDLQGYKALPAGESLRFMVGDASIEAVSDLASAERVIRAVKHLHSIVINGPEYDFLKQVQALHPEAHVVLVTDQPMKDYSAALKEEEDKLVGHVVANRQRDGATLDELRVTLVKRLRQDLFGIEKYLASNTPIHRYPVTGTRDRDPLNARIQQFVEECHLGQHMGKIAFGIAEELLMNTIYDAPVAAGLQSFTERDRHEEWHLGPAEQGEFSYGCDGRILAIATSDPFGALSREKLLQYTRKILMRRDSPNLIDAKKGGAGLGFFKILYSSHALVCNVAPGKRTEIMALIDVTEPLRDFAKMTRSIHYFS